MKSLSLRELEQESALYDEATDATPGLDVFCSSLDWGLPAHGAFGASREPWLWKTDAGYVSLMKGTHPEELSISGSARRNVAFGSPVCSSGCSPVLLRDRPTIFGSKRLGRGFAGRHGPP